jgi:predicted amidophosphoribosyltransferase
MPRSSRTPSCAIPPRASASSSPLVEDTNPTQSARHPCARRGYPTPGEGVAIGRIRGRGALHLLDLLVPERCAACGAGERIVCPACLASLRLLRGPLCARCGAPTAWPVERCAECAGRRLSFARARAAVAYDGPARMLVSAWKERGQRRLGGVFARLVAEVVPPPSAAVVTFVPGDPERIFGRGQNPAEALARLVALEWGLPVQALLVRRRKVRPQRGLSRPARRQNVREAFEAIRAPAAVVLVDDVYTTGATVLAAATELRRAGARAVDVVTFARAVRR